MISNLSGVLWRIRGKSNYQNFKYGEFMETVRAVILFHGGFMVKLFWRLSWVSWTKHGKSSYQTIFTLIL